MCAEIERLAIIVPVNPTQLGKSRLSKALTVCRRHKLNLGLLKRTLTEAGKLTDIADVIVVSKSSEVRALADQRGFKSCVEPADCNLNEAIAIGAQEAMNAGATEIMVLPVDLPYLSAGHLKHAIDEFRTCCDVMIITDIAGKGTNLLLWRPVAMSLYLFGEDSAQRHADAARNLGLRVGMRNDRLLSFDLDTPEDLTIWSRGRSKVIGDRFE